MRKIRTTAAILCASAFGTVMPASAESAPHVAGGVVVEYNNLDIALVASGWSVVKLLRGDVYNAGGDFVGYVHDALVLPDGDTTFVIVNVAGFLNIGEKLIALPAGAFEINADGDLVLPNATKDNLKSLPRFHYARN
ncbi:PRC-barrel domain-containing protein [Phaeobacter sp. NW0010-22]|uniref:PRC-barrel domain-containing protein n=1 Tax=Phaeobacter sp. NW0010-22 TaxID=3135907 RepID=UPI0033429992